MKNLESTEYDLLVVGAGIYGAWMAYDATLRGLKVLLIDKGDIASGTSSASSKLIHGGLRYLEQFNFSLVKKSVKERQNLFTIAPHRVSPLKFGIPVYKGSRIASWKYSIGLTLYDWFANIRKDSFKHSTLSENEFFNEFPALKKDSFKKGFSYLDANTDDFRYTLEIIDGAIKSGATVKTYCELIDYENQVANVKFTNTDEQCRIRFKYAINATGQWTDNLFKSDMCRLSKGVHIILPSLKLKQALLLLSPIDERVFFAIPWYGKTMIGTTDTDYKEQVEQIKPEPKDIDYLLESINHYLNDSFSHNDIISSFAGLRVLKNDKGHPSSVTRDWEWREIDKNIFVSLGGKLTSSREDASLLIDHICTKLSNDKNCITNKTPFPWTPNNFIEWKEEIKRRAYKLNLNSEQIDLLISRQGKRTKTILEAIENNKELASTIIENLPFTVAEFEFILKHEYVSTFEDLIRRRFPITLLKKLSDNDLKALRHTANSYLESLGKNKLL